MIEVLFGESEAGAMKAAKSTVITSKVDGPTSVWMAGKKKPPQREGCGWIEGTAEEVICLGFLLDIGNIREEVNSEYRKHLIYSLYAQEPWEKEEKMDAELMQLCDCYCAEMERLKAYLEEGGSNQGVVQRCSVLEVWILPSVCQPFKIPKCDKRRKIAGIRNPLRQDYRFLQKLG